MECQQTGGVEMARYRLWLRGADVAKWLAHFSWRTEVRALGSLMKVNAARPNGAAPLPPYAAAAIAGLLHEQLLAAGKSFSFETVMSHPGKAEFLRKPRAAGYRTCLYFGATDAVELNVRCVQVRERSGGHSAQERKIRENCVRSLALLPAAPRHADHAGLFDNSSSQHVLLAEASEGKQVALHVRENVQPAWFRKMQRALR